MLKNPIFTALILVVIVGIGVDEHGVRLGNPVKIQALHIFQVFADQKLCGAVFGQLIPEFFFLGQLRHQKFACGDIRHRQPHDILHPID